MEQKQIIHIASEVVVISGLAIYFKLKTNSLSTQIDELKKRLATQEQLVEEFRNRLDEQTFLISKQEQLLTSFMLKQSQAIKPQKSIRTVPRQNLGIVWDSDDSEYIREDKPSQRKKHTEPINIDRRHVEQQIERPLKKQVEKQIERPLKRQVEQPLERPIKKHDEQQIERPIKKEVEQPLERPLKNQVEIQVEQQVEEEEDLDDELENELRELQKQSDSESEIIEIDTSLKKKV